MVPTIWSKSCTVVGVVVEKFRTRIVGFDVFRGNNRPFPYVVVRRRTHLLVVRSVRSILKLLLIKW